MTDKQIEKLIGNLIKEKEITLQDMIGGKCVCQSKQMNLLTDEDLKVSNLL